MVSLGERLKYRGNRSKKISQLPKLPVVTPIPTPAATLSTTITTTTHQIASHSRISLKLPMSFPNIDFRSSPKKKDLPAIQPKNHSYHAVLAATGGRGAEDIILKVGSNQSQTQSQTQTQTQNRISIVDDIHHINSNTMVESSDKDSWFEVPVFDAYYWYCKGGMALLREKNDILCDKVEALVIKCPDMDSKHVLSCMALGWPNITVLEITYDKHNIEIDADARKWLKIVQDRYLFPKIRLYRLTANWIGCTEVFEHLLNPVHIDQSRVERLELMRRLPESSLWSENEVLFYKYRILFLTDVSFDMDVMGMTTQGALAMHTYFLVLFKTDLFSPSRLGLSGTTIKRIGNVFEHISRNIHTLGHLEMRCLTNGAALQSSLKHLCIEMRIMSENLNGIQLCSAHFPQLESLIITHTPDFKCSQSDSTNLGVLFSLPWASLIELQLPFISDTHINLLHSKCPKLRFLTIKPESRYELWSEYSLPFSPEGLQTLVNQWPQLRQLTVKYAFRPTSQDNSPVAASRLSRDNSDGSQSRSRRSYHISLPSSASAALNKASATLGFSRSKGTDKDSRDQKYLHKLSGSDTVNSADMIRRQNGGFQTHHQRSTQPMRMFATEFWAQTNANMSVLVIPYLKISFQIGIELLTRFPQLQIFEFSATLSKPETPPSESLGFRQSSVIPINQPETIFANPGSIAKLEGIGHPLKALTLHNACTKGYFSTAWIRLINMFKELEAVTFITLSNDDISMVERLARFCTRNDASFAIDVRDQAAIYKTSIDFAERWDIAHSCGR